MPSIPALSRSSSVRPALAVVTIDAPEYLEVSVDTAENAILTLALPAYTAVSAVAVPAGQHTVTLRFVPYTVII